MSGNEDLTPQEMADNIRAMRRAGGAQPRGVAYYHRLGRESVRVAFENMRYRLAFSVTKAVRHFHSAREVIEFVQEVEPHLRD